MITFAILTGIYSYCIFLLGLVHLLYPVPVGLLSGLFLLLTYFFCFKKISILREQVQKFSWLQWVLICLFILQAGNNFLAALAPVTAFDALWYHLTLPKLYVLYHSIYFIPGGLLYYSAMPKLGEMFYTAVLLLHGEVFVSLVQWVFGLLVCLQLYNLARNYYSRTISLLAVCLFYANLVVAWESTTAYIDLIRTFYEMGAVMLFLDWIESRKHTTLYLSALLIGFAIATKLLSFGTAAILVLLLVYQLKKHNETVVSIVQKTGLFIVISVLVPLPWLIFSYSHTGNPFYPFFTSLYPTHISSQLLNPLIFLRDTVLLLTHADDPLSPMYLLCLPFFFLYSKFRSDLKVIAQYSLLGLIAWYLTPRTGGGRFILPYLPFFSLLCVEVITVLEKQKKKTLAAVLITVVIIISMSTLLYRSIRTYKYVPYLVGRESKEQFLLRHLEFSFGDFYDVNHGIKNKLGSDDVVLLLGFHNLYYVDFPFIDVSWIQTGDRFTYVATQNSQLPPRFLQAKKVYTNPQTLVTLYMVGETRW